MTAKVDARVDVKLGARSYPILIGCGLLSDAAGHCSEVLPKARFAIVADEAVRGYADEVKRGLAAKELLLGEPIYVPSGEGSKSFSELERVCNALLDLGIERGHAVIAVGGGVTGDLAGFAAAIVKRGVPFVQVPTTLLAMVNSSVGGKTGIDTAHGKNLAGAFYQPSLVIADLDTLKTLPKREFRAGYAEVVKYGALGDAAFFRWLEQNGQAVFDQERDDLVYMVETCCQMKAAIVSRDERESGDRALLNLGHTFAHALEAWAGYSGGLLHGEAVALGMMLAAQFSFDEGLCGPQVASRLKTHLGGLGLPVSFADIRRQLGRGPSVDELMGFMEQDKKVKSGEMTLILFRGMGDAFAAPDVKRGPIRAFLQSQI